MSVVRSGHVSAPLATLCRLGIEVLGSGGRKPVDAGKSIDEFPDTCRYRIPVLPVHLQHTARAAQASMKKGLATHMPQHTQRNSQEISKTHLKRECLQFTKRMRS